MNAMEACILEDEERQARVAEIDGTRYVEDEPQSGTPLTAADATTRVGDRAP